MQKSKNEKLDFIWGIVSAHTIAYFIAGLFALLFLNYKAEFGSEVMSLIMRPVDSPWVAVGPGLQIFRGAVLAFILLPFKDIFTAKYGWLKLTALILGLSYFFTLGPTFGSFEGYLYTTIPLQYHLLGLPETILYTFLFALLFLFLYKRPEKLWRIISIVFVILIVVMSLLGVLDSLGIIAN